MTSIFLGTMHGKWMPTRFGWERERVIEHLRRDGLFGGATWAEGLRVDRNYNQCVKDFLATEATHLLMLNDDMGYPDSLGYRMLETQAPIAGGLYFSREGQWAGLPHWYEYVSSGEDEWGQPCRKYRPMVNETLIAIRTGEMLPIDATGTGCLLIAREVVETVLEGPWFQTAAGTQGDLMFFWKARTHGLEVMGNPKVVCDHFTPTSVGVASFMHTMAVAVEEHGLPVS